MQFRKIISGGTMAAAALGAATPALAGTESYLGEVTLVAFNFCPRGTAEMNGQLLPIADFIALFALLGTTYGGDGRTTFALPDLRGRVVVDDGQGPGLPNTRQGERWSFEASPRKSGEVAATVPSVTLKYCIATQGIFPSRP